MKRDFGGIIWTNHAITRMNQRGVSQGTAWATWKRPDRSRYNKSKDVWIYQRNFSGEEIEVVAKKNDKKEWLILSVWSKKANKNRNPVNVFKIIRKLFSIFR